MLTHWIALSRFCPYEARRPVHRLGVLLKLLHYPTNDSGSFSMLGPDTYNALASISLVFTDLTMSQGDKVRSITGGVVLLTKVFFLTITFSGVSKVRSMTSLFPWL